MRIYVYIHIILYYNTYIVLQPGSASRCDQLNNNTNQFRAPARHTQSDVSWPTMFQPIHFVGGGHARVAFYIFNQKIAQLNNVFSCTIVKKSGQIRLHSKQLTLDNVRFNYVKLG